MLSNNKYNNHHFILTHVDRFCRNITIGCQMLEFVKQRNATITFIDQRDQRGNVLQYNQYDFQGNYETIVESLRLAQYESESIARRAIDGKQTRKRKIEENFNEVLNETIELISIIYYGSENIVRTKQLFDLLIPQENAVLNANSQIYSYFLENQPFIYGYFNKDEIFEFLNKNNLYISRLTNRFLIWNKEKIKDAISMYNKTPYLPEYGMIQIEKNIMELIKLYFFGCEMQTFYDTIRPILNDNEYHFMYTEIDGSQKEYESILYGYFAYEDIAKILNNLNIKDRSKKWSVKAIESIVKNFYISQDILFNTEFGFITLAEKNHLDKLKDKSEENFLKTLFFLRDK
jgi:hypothetical protein